MLKPLPKAGKTAGTVQFSVPQEPTKLESELQEEELEKRTTSQEDEKAQRIQEIAEVAAMDVGEEAPTIPIPEKQKWLIEHPFVPIPALPHVVAKYPHPETAFEKAHKTLENEFNGQLREELKKFGIASTTNGISDTTYNSISTALEKQRSLRMSQIHGNERKLVEYERGAIVWHTQRAVHDRDMEIIESQFDVDSGSDPNIVTDDSGDESGRSNYNSTRSHQSHKSDFDSDDESKEEEDEVETAAAMKTSDHSSPRSSEMGESSDDLQEPEEVAKHSSKAEDSDPCASPNGRMKYVSRALPWKHKQAPISHFPSRQPTAKASVHIVDRSRQSDEVDEELGLGDWDSDEDTTVPLRGKQRRVQIDDRQPVSASQDSPIRDLSPPKELLDLQQLKSSMAYKPTPPPSSPKSSSAETTFRVQKPIPPPPLEPLERDESEANEVVENEESDGSDVEEKIFKELTSEIDEIISL